MTRLKLSLLTLMIAGAFLICFGAIRGATRQTQSPLQQEEATPIQEEQVTERQRRHRRLYTEHRTGRNLRELAARQQGGIRLELGTPLGGGHPDYAPPTRLQLITNTVCDADAIVLGTVNSKSSQLTEDEDFIFTEYEVSVEEVLKDNSAAHIALSDIITVLRPGGRILLGGQVFEAEDRTLQRFQRGNRYILFLRFIPDTGAYTTVSSIGSFRLHNDQLTSLTSQNVGRQFEGEELGLFLSQIHGAMAGGCNNRGRVVQ